MSGVLSSKVLESLAISNLISIAEQPGMLSNLAYTNLVANTNLSMQNAVANQQWLNQLGVAILGRTVNSMTGLHPLEVASANYILTGNTIAREIVALRAMLSAFIGSRQN